MVTMFFIGTLLIQVGIKKILIPCTVISDLLVIVMANVQILDQFVWLNIAIGAVGPASMVALGALTANWYVRSRGRALGMAYGSAGHPLCRSRFRWYAESDAI